MNEIINAAGHFPLASQAVSAEKLGNGHINATYLVTCAGKEKYVLQKINTHVFPDTETLMNNIFAVTAYLNGLEAGSSLNFLKTIDGKKYYSDETGCYRVYEYVQGVCLEKALKPEELGTCGEAFGEFQMRLKGFDASALGETIPRFHDTVKRINDLKAAAREDRLGRLAGVKNEYEFYISREAEAGSMLRMLEEGKLKKRVTHNDTKLNNVLLDSVTLRPRCVIDLDTVMPGLAGNDFGDCIRSGATTGAEDEKDLSKVNLDLTLYRAFAKGFVSKCGCALTEDELLTLPLGAKLMTYECGSRFLADYLAGDTYFHIAYPEHNLVRCRTQMKLVADTEKRWNELMNIISEVSEA